MDVLKYLCSGNIFMRKYLLLDFYLEMQFPRISENFNFTVIHRSFWNFFYLSIVRIFITVQSTIPFFYCFQIGRHGIIGHSYTEVNFISKFFLIVYRPHHLHHLDQQNYCLRYSSHRRCHYNVYWWIHYFPRCL